MKELKTQYQSMKKSVYKNKKKTQNMEMDCQSCRYDNNGRSSWKN